ncbi:MAG TPA: acetyltransferase [Flavobacteriaceae bacterium]|mgnify:CR=1 FL=1|nr:acetyltransferase [Flavobacteriaceae bacterium]MCB9213478.1 acetyltransferase [Alteromonas sp.]HPF12219.1 acetyltransferase [Flavobacteriaceae bacterium]HQU21994.1 acetyltransferase [Flavobacteriaceae bacterium]HQU65893.1 acetyltransferase [Flavobacteriaceae bacterium]
MKHELIMYGAGGHSYAIVELIRCQSHYVLKEIYDDTPKVSSLLGVPVHATPKQFATPNALCIAIGDNATRKDMALRFHEASFPAFVHPSVTQYPSVIIGNGTVVLPLVVLDAGVEIGDFCILNNHATISHQVKIENFVHVAIQAAIAGGVSIGEGAFIGAGSVILPELKIGKWAVVGAGAVVTKDVPDYAVVVGNPAKIIKFNETNEG